MGNKVYVYTGSSPFLKQYVDFKNHDGWKGWEDFELEEMDNYFHGYWKSYDTPSRTTYAKSVTLGPPVTLSSPIEETQKTEKTQKKFDWKEKLCIFVQKLGGFFVNLFRKLLMEEDGDRYNRQEH